MSESRIDDRRLCANDVEPTTSVRRIITCKQGVGNENVTCVQDHQPPAML